MEVPESLFARLEDDIIVHIASALPLNDASNFMLVTCKRTHTLATTRIDTWWNWVGAMAALEEEFPLPESYTNEEEDQSLTPHGACETILGLTQTRGVCSRHTRARRQIDPAWTGHDE